MRRRSRSLRGKRVLAFAGIGDPARFFNTLRASGIDVAGQRAFADHHPYSQAEIESLIAEAKRDALTLVTTEKDLARLRRRSLPDWAQQIVPFAVTLEFDDPALLAEVRRPTGCSRRARGRNCRVGKAKRAHHLTACSVTDGGHGADAPLPTLRSVQPCVFSAPGKCRCSTAVGTRIGLLQIDAPVFQLVERDPHVGDRAAHIGSGRDHAEIAVQILHLRFAMARGTEFIQHGRTLRLAGPRGPALSVFSRFDLS